MASPPSFSLSDEDEPPSAAALTPNGLNDRLLRFTQSRPRPPPPQNPYPDTPAQGEDSKVKLSGSRRLCKLAASPPAQDAATSDPDSIRDILDDFTALLDSMSVHNPRPGTRQPAPLPCALNTADDGQEDSDCYYDAATSSSSSPPPPHPKSDEDDVVDFYSSDDEAATAVVRKEVKVEKPQAPAPPVAPAFAANRGNQEETSNEGNKTAGGAYGAGGNKLGERVPKPSSFLDWGDDGDGASQEEKENREKAANAVVRRADKVEKSQVPAPPFAFTFTAGTGAEKHAVGWEKTEDFKMEPTGCGLVLQPYKLPGSILKMLYPHQREGVEWLWALHCRGTGGILGDDMGLGKTMQISAFLAGLFHSRLIKRVLVVVPRTLVTHWSKELSVVGLKSKIREVKFRDSELQYAFKDGGIVLTTYDLASNNYKLIRGDFYDGNIEAKYDRLIRGDLYDDADEDEDGKLWDYVILDEGQKIKNPKTDKAINLRKIPCGHRIVISGTPMENNLMVQNKI